MKAIDLEQAILRLETLATIAPLLLERARVLTPAQYIEMSRDNDFYGPLCVELPKAACGHLSIDLEALESERQREALFSFNLRGVIDGRLPAPAADRRVYHCTYDTRANPCNVGEQLMTLAEAAAHLRMHEEAWETSNVRADLEEDVRQRRAGARLTIADIRDRAGRYSDVSAPAARQAILEAIAADLRALEENSNDERACIAAAAALLAEVAADAPLAAELDLAVQAARLDTRAVAREPAPLLDEQLALFS